MMRDEIKLTGIFLMFFPFVVMTLTFLVAYNNPTKSVVVHIDKVGEADWELILIIVSGILGFVAIVFEYQDFRQKRLNERLYLTFNQKI